MKPLLLFILLTLSSIGNADPVKIGQPMVNGPGCPEGTARAVLSPDGNAISILFDQFSLSVNGGNYRFNDPQISKICRFRIPIELPDGFNVETTQLQYRGFASIPANGRGYLVTSGPAVRFGRFGRSGDVIRQEFGAMNDNFFVTQQVQQDFRGRCQQQRFIEFTTQIWVGGMMWRGMTSIPGPTQLTLDSVDMGDSGIDVGIRAMQCR